MFEGLKPRRCGAHRSVGARAWCHDCGEWCSELAPCHGCHQTTELICAECTAYFGTLNVLSPDGLVVVEFTCPTCGTLNTWVSPKLEEIRE